MAKQADKARQAADGAADAAAEAVEDKAQDLFAGAEGISPNVRTNLVIADIVMRGGEMLLRRGIESKVLGLKTVPKRARDIVKGRTMTETLVSTAIARVATRSVPGAILVGGGLLAKALYDRRKGKAKAKAEGISPNVRTNLVIADIVMRGGEMLLRRGIESKVLGLKTVPKRAKDIVKGRTMTETLVSTAIARVATRSVPGAILVGGGMLAKALYDRRKGKAKAKAEGEAQLDTMAERGKDG